jgi:hypothetical protein
MPIGDLDVTLCLSLTRQAAALPRGAVDPRLFDEAEAAVLEALQAPYRAFRRT